MSKRSFRVALAIVVGSVVVTAALGVFLLFRALRYPHERRAGSGAEVAVTIESGMSFPRIAGRLSESGVIDRPRWFRLYAMQRGVTTKVRSGDFVFRDNLSPEEVLDTLLAGVEEVMVSVTIPEGIHMLEVFQIFELAEVASAAELEVLARDPKFLAARGVVGETIEGYLFPETYKFKVPTPPEVVLETLLKQHRIVWDRVRRQNARSLDSLREELGWSDHEFLTMASIVEKEAVVDEERARIAQVFINRLVSPAFVPHRLDTDPTIRYGCMVPLVKSPGCQIWDPTQRLRRAQLDDKENLYNTYQHDGLPPGPICNPGEKSMVATLNPDGSKYLFFVGRNDGTHIFSRTRAQHERAVDEFQR